MSTDTELVDLGTALTVAPNGFHHSEHDMQSDNANRNPPSLAQGVLEQSMGSSMAATVEMTRISFGELCSPLVTKFVPIAKKMGIGYNIDVALDCPAHLVSDPKHLGQVLHSLIARAFAGSRTGEVRVQIGVTTEGWSGETSSLVRAPLVLAISVYDAGPPDGEDSLGRVTASDVHESSGGYQEPVAQPLGLDALVQVLGGELVESNAGIGGPTTLYLPAWITDPSHTLLAQLRRTRRLALYSNGLLNTAKALGNGRHS
jgi:hypothetical protein